MSGTGYGLHVFAAQPEVCTCTKRNCPRHGNCTACRNYHANARRARPPYCEREPNWFKRMFGARRPAR